MHGLQTTTRYDTVRVEDGLLEVRYDKWQGFNGEFGHIGGGSVSTFDPAIKVDGAPMTSGYISIQAETAPTDFRKIELLNLEGCMDPKASNYKQYFVKANPQSCKY